MNPLGPYSFRSAQPDDANQVGDLVDAAYTHHVARIGMVPGPMTDDYHRVIRDADVHVAERDANIVGILVLDVTDEGFVLENVAVHPTEWGKGLGTALLALAEDEAKRAGFSSIYLYTHEKMTENLTLYSKIGYVEYDRRSLGDFSRVFMRKQLESTGAPRTEWSQHPE